MSGAGGSRPVAVAVVGAGPAGSAAALRLRHHGVGPILLAEAGAFGTFRIGESVPPDTRLPLRELGVWPAFLAQGHEPCLGSCSSWGDDALGYNDFVTNPYGHGWHLDRRRFDALLAGEAARRGARLELGWRLEAAEPLAAGGWALTFETVEGGPRRVEAALVIDATGRRARFARMAGARRRHADRLVCVAGRLTLADGNRLGRMTRLEATSYGWWYAARLPGGQSVVSVTTDPERCGRLALHDPASWLGHLAQTRHLGALLDGSAFDPGSLGAHPAPSFRLDPMCGEDWLAAGDAASSHDPLASQGIHKALTSGMRAGDAIAGRLAGATDGLSAYGAALEQGWEDFLRLRAHLYALETRWPVAPFWRARRSPPGITPAAG